MIITLKWRQIPMQETNQSAFANTETAPTPAQQHPRSPTSVLFHYEPHQPRNVNRLQEAEQAASGFNTRVAVALTKGVGTMWTAYAFVVLAFIGLFAILGLLNPIVALLVAWASQTFLQLVFLPIIMVGQNVLRRKTELQADEQFSTTMSTYHDIEPGDEPSIGSGRRTLTPDETSPGPGRRTLAPCPSAHALACEKRHLPGTTG